MIIDTLRDIFKSLEPDIATLSTCFTQAGYQKRLHELDAIVNQENFWQHKDRVTLTQEHQQLKELCDEYTTLVQNVQDAHELIELYADNEELLESTHNDARALVRAIHKFKLRLLLKNPEDRSSCFLTINAGAGGTESQDWAEILLRMYIRFCEREGFAVNILDYQAGEGAGLKSVVVYIKGKNAYGFLRCEHGVHRLVRISPFDANKRRHTSFAAVSAMPEVPDTTIVIKDDDLRIDTYRAGGAGGQHVNKTDSAVRITHLPTNIVVQCQNERSQGQNKQTAMKMLMAKLVEKQEEEKHARDNSFEKKKIEWGSQLRSYVLHPYKMVKDHRTDYESPQPDVVLDGDIMPFIEAYLVHSTKVE